MKYIKNKKFIVAVIIIVLVIIGISIARRDGGKKLDTASVVMGDLVRTVRVSGKVISGQSANLAFAAGGTVSRVHAAIGDTVAASDVIVELDKASLSANLLKAQSDLAAAQAELAGIEGGADSTAKIHNVEGEAVQKITAAFTASDDAIHNKVDQLFTNPRSQNPEITPSFKGYELRMRINQTRVEIESILSSWRTMTTGLSVSTYTANNLSQAQAYETSIISFLNDIATAANSLETNATLDQTTIDKYRTDVAAARSAVNNAMSDMVAQADKISETMSDIPVQTARVASAEANVAAYRAQLEDATIRAPFSGIISRQDAKVGQAASANTTLVSIISKDVKIEAFVPEVSIAGLSVGNTATVTLDAYGPGETFTATVTHIDPAETVRDGVSNYRIELAFTAQDGRIRPGMTANVTIETLRKPGVLMIPARAVENINGTTTVRVMEGEQTTSRQVSVGVTDSEGNVEVLSGLSEGDTVLLDPVSMN